MSRFARVSSQAREVGSWIGAFRNIWWVLVVVTLAAAGVWRYAVQHQAGGVFTYAVTALFAGAFGYWMGVSVSQRRARLGDYRWVSADYTYRFDNSDILKHSQTVKIVIRANRPNVQIFKNRYSWTGTGKTKLSVPVGTHKLLGELPRRDSSWRYYFILLDNPLKKGAEATIEVQYDLYDKDKTYQPWIAKDVIEPMDALTLRVIFPKVRRPMQVLGAEMARVAGLLEGEWQIVKEQPLAVEPTSQVVYEILKPVTGHRYQILWSWPNYPRQPED